MRELERLSKSAERIVGASEGGSERKEREEERERGRGVSWPSVFSA